MEYRAVVPYIVSAGRQLGFRARTLSGSFMLACGLHCTLVPLHVVHLKLRMPASEKFIATTDSVNPAVPLDSTACVRAGQPLSRFLPFAPLYRHRCLLLQKDKRSACPRLYQEERNRCSSIPSHASERHAA